jgi:hypothetical protein
MGTRSDPKTDITLLDKCWSSRLGPMVQSKDVLYNSRCVINACIPYERIGDFPAVVQTSQELAQEVIAKFPDVFA